MYVIGVKELISNVLGGGGDGGGGFGGGGNLDDQIIKVCEVVCHPLGRVPFTVM